MRAKAIGESRIAEVQSWSPIKALSPFDVRVPDCIDDFGASRVNGGIGGGPVFNRGTDPVAWQAGRLEPATVLIAGSAGPCHHASVGKAVTVGRRVAITRIG